MGHFNVSSIVWAKSQVSVHKPHFLKRRERTAEADRTTVLLLTSQNALPLGHIGSHNLGRGCHQLSLSSLSAAPPADHAVMVLIYRLPRSVCADGYISCSDYASVQSSRLCTIFVISLLLHGMRQGQYWDPSALSAFVSSRRG